MDSTTDIDHAVGLANEIVSVTTDDGSTPVTAAYVHDLAGNLVFDGTLLYQYDGLNRLVQVNAAGDLLATDFDAAGQITGDPVPEAGATLAAFVYDGLGRLIQTTRYDLDQSGEQNNQQVESYYYDGVRRIMERYYEVASQPAGPLTMLMEALSFTFIQPG